MVYDLECRTGIWEFLCLEKMQLSEDAQGILQPRRHFCDLSKRENLLPSAVLGSNTRLHSRVGKNHAFPPSVERGIIHVEFPLRGLANSGCALASEMLYGSPHLRCDLSSVRPQLSRPVLEKCLFLYFL